MKVHMNCLDSKLFKNSYPYPLCNGNGLMTKKSFTKAPNKVTCKRCLKCMKTSEYK